jgi:hypothetical protein
MPQSSLYFDGHKFMWDGKEYESEEEAKNACKSYEDEGFEIKLVGEKGKHLVYTRREVEEVIVEGAPPGF